MLDCTLTGREIPKRIGQKVRAYVLSEMLEELKNRPSPYADYLTLATTCERSGLTLTDLADLKAARLLVPDYGELYRPKLASWAGKLAYLLRAGWSLAELKAWACGRWQAPPALAL